MRSYTSPCGVNIAAVAALDWASSDGRAALVHVGEEGPGEVPGGGVSGSISTLVAGVPAIGDVITTAYYPDARRVRRGWVVMVPYPTVAGVLAAGTGIALWRERRRWMRARWRTQGRCPRCGYDLHATPDRCPECGTAVANGAGDARRPSSAGV